MLQGKLPVHHERDLFAQTRRFAVAPLSYAPVLRERGLTLLVEKLISIDVLPLVSL